MVEEQPSKLGSTKAADPKGNPVLLYGEAPALATSRSGQGAPASDQALNAATNSSCGTDTGARLPPGCQPHSTSLSSATCSSMASRSRPPFCFLSLIIAHSSEAGTPIQAIF